MTQNNNNNNKTNNNNKSSSNQNNNNNKNDTRKNNDNDNNDNNNRHQVRFGNIEIYEFAMTLGNHPCVSYGPPVCLSNNEQTSKEKMITMKKLSIDEYEHLRAGKRRHGRRLILNYYQRLDVIHAAGITNKKEINKVLRTVYFDQVKRDLSKFYCYPYLYVAAIRATIGRQKTKKFLRQYNKK